MAKRKVGRPRLSKSKTVRMGISLPKSLLKEIIADAEKAGLSLSEYVRSKLEVKVWAGRDSGIAKGPCGT